MIKFDLFQKDFSGHLNLSSIFCRSTEIPTLKLYVNMFSIVLTIIWTKNLPVLHSVLWRMKVYVRDASRNFANQDGGEGFPLCDVTGGILGASSVSY